jgi:hypothetical protein
VLGGRALLLVLDNFEHVLEGAAPVADLLLRCAGLKALATSRALLRVSGEHELPVLPLGLPPAAHNLAYGISADEMLTDEVNAVVLECRCQAIAECIGSKKRMEGDVETELLEIERLAGTSLADRFAKPSRRDGVRHGRRQCVEIHDRVER